MTKAEWRSLVEHIYHTSIAPRFARISRKFHPFEFFERHPGDLQRLPRAMQALRFIDGYLDDEDDLTDVFAPNFVENVVQNVENGLAWNERLVIDTGVAEVIQHHFDAIVDGMEASDMPEEDTQILRLSGSSNPQLELQLLVESVKKGKDRLIRPQQLEGGDFPSALRLAHSRVSKTRQRVAKANERMSEGEPPEPSEQSPPKKRWFKGLGGICQGTMLTIVDATLVAGFWPIPLPLETRSVGAVVSITSGIGTILTGIGDLRGE